MLAFLTSDNVMKAKVVNKPHREPDVILPEYMNITTVSIWISERVFEVGHACFDSISSENLNLICCPDPLIYLKAVASKSSRTNPRKKIATDFLEELDSILLGG